MEKPKEKPSSDASVFRIKDQHGKDIVIPEDDLIQEAAVYLEQDTRSLLDRNEMKMLQAQLALRRTLEKYNPLIKPDHNLEAQIRQAVPKVLELFEERKE